MSLWDWIRQSGLWRLLKRVRWLRNGLYLAIELRRSFLEPEATARGAIDADFVAAHDPWRYETNPMDGARFADQTAMIDAVRAGRTFRSGVEIGCAEGLYTEVLADRCESLLVLDVSPTALARSKARGAWPECVEFRGFDLAHDTIPGTYELVVVAGVLEYFSRPATLRRIREKLAAAVSAQGYLMVETTRMPPVIEESWWGRKLLRGRWTNDFVAAHPSLAVVRTIEREKYSVTLCRKTA